MSRGSGRLQRRILQLLERSPERKMDRKELDEVLVEAEGFDPSNLLRSIRGLAREYRVGFTDGRHKEESMISLPRKVRSVTNAELTDLLEKLGGGR